jgi:gp16 family phage-associated protein
MKTGEQVRREFVFRGESISAWARKHGFSAAQVFEVIAGRNRGRRGKAHEIAVMLGMKNGAVEGPR